MSHRRSRLRLRAPLALLVAVLALLAPVARASADDTPISLTPEQTREALVVAGWVGHLSLGTDGARDLLLQRVLQEAYALNPQLAPGDAVAAIQDLQSRLPASVLDPLGTDSPNEAILSMLHTMDSPHPAGVEGDALTHVVNQALQESARTSDLGQQMAPDADSGWSLAGGSFDPTAVMSASAALANTNASFAQAWDTLWKASAGYSILATTQDLLADAPGLQSADIHPVVALVGPDNAIHTTLQTVNQQDADQQSTLQQNAIDTIHSADPAVNEDPSVQQQRAAVTQQAVSSTSLLSKVSGFASSSTGKRIEAAGQMLGKLNESYTKWSTAVKGLSGISRYANLSTLSMAGGVLGAVQFLGPIMGLPDQNQQMMTALAQISAQIDEMKQEMNARFDEIDQRLDAGFGQLNSRLDTVVSYLQSISTKLDALQTSVNQGNAAITQALHDIANLQVSVDQLQANLYQVAQDTITTNTWQVINGAIGYQQSNAGGQPLPTDHFVTAAGSLYTFGTTSSTGDTLEPLVGRSWAPGDLVTELEKFTTLDSNLEYLRQLPAQRLGLPALGDGSSDRLADPQEWALASHAFSQLLLENPGQVTQTQRDQLTTLSNEGARVRGFMQQVGTSDTSDGSGSTLFNALLDEYRNQVGLVDNPSSTSLAKAVQADETTYLNTLTGNGSPATLSLNLWGGPDQAIDTNNLGMIDGLTGFSSTPPYSQLPFTPLDGDWNYVPNVYKIAQRLGLGMLDGMLFDEMKYTPKGGSQYELLQPNCTSYIIVCGAPNLVATQAQQDAVRAQVEAVLESDQRGLYGYLAQRASDNSTLLYQALRRVQGIKEAIYDYIQLGLGGAMTNDETLQEMLTDGNRLLDPSTFTQAMQALAATGSALPPIDGTTKLDQLQTQRLTDLAAAIKNDLAPAPSSPAGTRRAAMRADTSGVSAYQGSPLVDGTMNRLALTQSVMQNPPLADGSLAPPAPPQQNGGGGTPPSNGGGGTPASNGGGATSSNSGGGGQANGGGGTAHDAVAPVLSNVKLASAAFGHRKGTRLSFHLDRAATVLVTLTRAATGHRSHGRCSARVHRGRRCTLGIAAGGRSLRGRAGADSAAFGAGLRRGSYVARLVATAGGATSRPVLLHFVVR